MAGIRRKITRFVNACKRHGKILAIKGSLIVLGVKATTGTASATEMSINWTQIGDIISGAGSIMPAVGELVVAVVPVLLLLIVVGFVTGLFDGIVGAIQDAFRMFRR